MGTEEFNQVMEPAQPIGGKNRELFHRIRTPARNSFSNHTLQLATSLSSAHQELSGAGTKPSPRSSRREPALISSGVENEPTHVGCCDMETIPPRYSPAS